MVNWEIQVSTIWKRGRLSLQKCRSYCANGDRARPTIYIAYVSSLDDGLGRDRRHDSESQCISKGVHSGPSVPGPVGTISDGVRIFDIADLFPLMNLKIGPRLFGVARNCTGTRNIHFWDVELRTPHPNYGQCSGELE
jgi:hypothetical protein